MPPSPLSELIQVVRGSFGSRLVVEQGSFCGSSAAPKKKAFERGGPGWPPRSNAKHGRTAPKKKNLIKAAPFGRLDQMLWTAVQGEAWGGFAHPAETNSLGGGLCTPAKIENT